MGRIYSVGFQAVTATVAQDLLQIVAGSGMAFALHELTLEQRGLTAVEIWNISLRRFPATITGGSGGGSVTPAKHNFGDAAATVTARANDTTVATTSGTPVILRPDAVNILNGWFYLPAPEDRIVIPPLQSLIWRLDTAPSASCAISGNAVIEELF